MGWRLQPAQQRTSQPAAASWCACSLPACPHAVPGRPPCPPADAAAAINSTCQDLNTTGCCTEVAGNYTWVQYGLGVSRTACLHRRLVLLVRPSGRPLPGRCCTLPPSLPPPPLPSPLPGPPTTTLVSPRALTSHLPAPPPAQAPMYVRGIKVTAPAGNCCSDGDCTLGTEPCNEQLLNAWVYVANTRQALGVKAGMAGHPIGHVGMLFFGRLAAQDAHRACVPSRQAS